MQDKTWLLLLLLLFLQHYTQLLFYGVIKGIIQGYMLYTAIAHLLFKQKHITKTNWYWTCEPLSHNLHILSTLCQFQLMMHAKDSISKINTRKN